ncbi:hypothetical protein KDC22_17315 [Paenibacillus tritici]|uniref:hypothetical protein n=1 Tax=Paenibacillus tritici TaxID=1873425 RepID=UPI001BADFDCF|nr:hypothetical protein [Paenibacillus tritici]QUL52230.1 hypothetical protein KDC22_17315 [Paenibacillus tritici]
MSIEQYRTHYARGILNETYNSRDSLSRYMHVSDVDQARFVIYGTNTHAKYYAALSSKLLYPKIELFVSEEEGVEEDGKKLRGFEVISVGRFANYIEQYGEHLKVIVFSDQYPEAVKRLQEMGLDPLKQLFDGRYIFDLKELDNGYVSESDNVNKVILTVESFRSNKGGLFVYDTASSSYTKHLSGDFRTLLRYKDGYLAMEDNNGMLYLNSDYEIERTVALPDADLHGMDIHRSGGSDYAYIIETAWDRIAVYDLESGKRVEQIEVGKSIVNSTPGMLHISDILIDNERILIAMASRSGMFTRGAFKDDGAILGMDMHDYIVDEVYAEQLNTPHSLIKIGKDILFCDSAKGMVYCNKQVLTQFNGFVRGLHFNGYGLYVGQNVPRHLPYLLQISPNYSNDTGIHTFVPSRRVSGFQKLPFCGQIYSILTE